MADVMAVCDQGHKFELKDFEPLDGVIAAISWCPKTFELPKVDGSLLTVMKECGARVLWLKRLPMVLDNPKRRYRLPKDRQLDLFDDLVIEDDKTKDLTNPTHDGILGSEGLS